MEEFQSFPEGYSKLVKKIVPWFMRPAKDMMMRLLLTILRDG